MPEITPCPRCGRKIRVADELLGKKIRCPKCSVTFVVEAPGGQLETSVADRPGRGSRERLEEEAEPRARTRRDEDDDDEEGPRRPRRRPPPANVASWERVRRGIGLMLIAVGIVILGWIVLAATTVLAMLVSTGVALSSKDVNTAIGTSVLAMIVVAGVAILFGLSYIVVRFIGHYETTTAPDREGARSLAVWGLWLFIGSLVVPVLYFLLAIVCFGVATGGKSATAAGLGAVLFMISMIIYYIVMGALLIGGVYSWLFFLRACARLVRAPGLAQSILFLILAVTLLFVAGLAMGGLSLLGNTASIGAGAVQVSGPGPQPVAGPSAASGLAGVVGMATLGCGCLTIFLSLATFIWTIVSMFLVRSAITRYIEGRA
jgi:hypothetical protein